MRDVRRTGGAHGLRGGKEKIVDGMSPARPHSFRYQRRSVNNCNPGRGGMAQDGGTKGGTFHGEMGRCRKARAGQRHAVVCPNLTRRTKERIAQSKRVCAGSLVIDNKPQVVRTCILRVFLFADAILPFSGLCFALFRFRISAFIEPATPRSIVFHVPRQPHAVR